MSLCVRVLSPEKFTMFDDRLGIELLDAREVSGAEAEGL
jgi:hypothetical protein